MSELEEMVEELLNCQIENWDLVHANYCALNNVKTRQLSIKDFPVLLQFNPERIRSSAAQIDAATLKKRPCFFCHRPKEQQSITLYNTFDILVNPYPISDGHLTMPFRWHKEQQILPFYEDMLVFAYDLREYSIIYNGPKCGASAPDHMHFQAIKRSSLPIEENIRRASKEIIMQRHNTTLYALNDYMTSVLLIASSNVQEAAWTFNHLYEQLEVKEGDSEPMMNVAVWVNDENVSYTCIFLRKELRPSCFYAEGDANILISPATVEMAGLFITPLEKDFEKVTAADLETILKEVSISEEEKDELVVKLRQSFK